MPFEIIFSAAAIRHLQELTAREQTTVLDRIEEQLTHQPLVQTRNRKPMRPNSIAPWELRIGNVRVFYDATEVPTPVVRIVAIGIKQGNKILIEGQEVK